MNKTVRSILVLSVLTAFCAASALPSVYSAKTDLKPEYLYTSDVAASQANKTVAAETTKKKHGGLAGFFDRVFGKKNKTEKKQQVVTPPKKTVETVSQQDQAASQSTARFAKIADEIVNTPITGVLGPIKTAPPKPTGNLNKLVLEVINTRIGDLPPSSVEVAGGNGYIVGMVDGRGGIPVVLIRDKDNSDNVQLYPIH